MLLSEHGNNTLVQQKAPLKHKADKAHIPGELHRKSVAIAFWEYELYQELLDMGIANTWVLTKEKVATNFSGSKDAAVEYIVTNRISTAYSHECHQGCRSKGCGKLYVLYGNWKLCYAHCMFPVPVTIVGYEKEINYPKICPRSPEYHSAFCDKHLLVVKSKGIPTDLKKFLQYCRNQNQGNLVYTVYLSRNLLHIFGIFSYLSWNTGCLPCLYTDPTDVLEDIELEIPDSNEDNAAVYQGMRSCNEVNFSVVSYKKNMQHVYVKTVL